MEDMVFIVKVIKQIDYQVLKTYRETNGIDSGNQINVKFIFIY